MGRTVTPTFRVELTRDDGKTEVSVWRGPATQALLAEHVHSLERSYLPNGVNEHIGDFYAAQGRSPPTYTEACIIRQRTVEVVAEWVRSPIPKMMPGQEPYTAEEFDQLNELLRQAADGDPGEQNEPKEATSMTASSGAASSGTKGDTPADLTDPSADYRAMAEEILGTSAPVEVVTTPQAADAPAAETAKPEAPAKQETEGEAPANTSEEEGLDALFALELDPKDFLRFLRTIKAVTDEAKLVVSHDRVSVLAVDPAHVAMVDASLKATGTTRGKRAKDVELGLDVSSAVKRLKDLVTLDQPWQDVRQYLQTIDHSGIISPKLPNLNMPARVTIDRKAFETYLRVIGTVTDHVEVSVQAGGKALRLGAQSDVVKVAKELPAEVVVRGDGAKSMFSLDYLTLFMQAYKQASIKTLRLELGTDFPVKMNGADGSLDVTYLLAPRILND